MPLPQYKFISLVPTLSFCLLLGFTTTSESAAGANDDIQNRLQKDGELTPFPEAKPLLKKIAQVIDSVEIKNAIANSPSLRMMRERVRTGLFHINFVFEVPAEDYPYEAPFSAPFPFRPTLESMEEALNFLELVEQITGFKTSTKEEIINFSYFEDLQSFIPPPKAQPPVTAIQKYEMALEPVDSYDIFQNRIVEHGELASFPEQADAVNGLLVALKSDDIQSLRATDPAFNEAAARSIAELEAVQRSSEAATRLQSEFIAPYPYRRTLQSLERAIMALDLRDRLRYPEGVNWHDVELSWFIGDKPKLLPLYHFNRYRYQLASLLADPETVLLPDWGGASFEHLIRLRVVPIGILEVSTSTSRIDRHHNSPADNLYHDANHIRRMRGYDRVKTRKLGAYTREAKMRIYRQQDLFIKKLLLETNPKTSPKNNPLERNLRKTERVVLFESTHETALTPDPESLLQDILRLPATPQPFEVQVQAPIRDLEEIRAFDGNLRSGADQLSLNMDEPTTIRYFNDRAPGFLANVDNKQRWGFFDSVFDMQSYMPAPDFSTPLTLAQAVLRLLKRLNYENPPSLKDLTDQITDRSGQQELWNYFGVRDMPVVKVSGMDLLNIAAADEIQSTWRRNTPHTSRWRPTNARLIDGTIVQDEWSLNNYLRERAVPAYLHAFFRLENDPVSGGTVLFEDIRNLPNEFLANNHQSENLISGAKAVSTVDRIWHKNLRFKSIDDAERWLVAAAQTVHQAVLDRNANGARNNPVYNRHWLHLPPQNQINDLELIRIAFDARLKKAATSRSTKLTTLDPATVTLINEALLQLYRKIRAGSPTPIRHCISIYKLMQSSTS